MSSVRPGLVWDACLFVTAAKGTALHSVESSPPWEHVNTPPRRLSGAELRLFPAWRAGQEVSTAAHDAGMDGDDLDRLLADLERMGLLVDDAPVAPSAGAEPEPAPDMPDPTGPLFLPTPQVWALTPDGYASVTHDGRIRPALDADALAVAAAFTTAATLEERRSDLAGELADAADADAIVAALAAAGVLVVPRATTAPAAAEISPSRLAATVRGARQLQERTRELIERSAESDRTPIYAVLPGGTTPPLSLGLILSHMRSWQGGALADRYHLDPRWIQPHGPVDWHPLGPAIYLFSDYLWSHEANLALSARIKDHNPEAITIHGGPDVPSYDEDTSRYFAEHPSVDIAVLGEGEETACELLHRLGHRPVAGALLTDELRTVEGIAFRGPAGLERTERRDRITDLDVIESPYLNGVFAAFDDLEGVELAIIETNRGCPYGCTFCDWGSATNSRIRKFDLERVFAELEWCARHQVSKIFVADANYGIFARDVEIAQRVADLRREFGYPHRLITNYAKNTVKHLKEIVQIVSDAGILTEGLLSLQSMDDDTLTAIRRSNIKLEKYEALASEFRKEQLPLFVDLMIGLPGQTVDSLREDLRGCVDREVLAKCHGTELLVNSPMNEPAYREEHELVSARPPGATRGGQSPALVISTTSFTRADYHEMHRVRRSYLLGENLGVFRIVGRFVRHEAGLHEVDLIERARLTAAADPARWPSLLLTTATVPDAMVPPISWARFADELGRFLVDEVGITDDSALAAAIAAQHAVLPAPGREFPYEVELEHDVAGWMAAVTDAKLGPAAADWAELVARLATFGPTRLCVEDPTDVCGRNLGRSSAIAAYNDWELDSPLARPTPGHHQI